MFLRNGVWTFKKRIPGRASPLQISLETGDRELAREKRDAELKKLAAGELAEIRGPRSKRASVGEVLAAYKTGVRTVTTIEDKTVKKCANDMHGFLQYAGISTGDATLITTLIDGKTVRTFKTNYLHATTADREAMAQRRRGAEALLRNMRAVFSRHALPLYRDLHLPKLDDFLREARVEAEDRKHGTIEAATLKQMDEELNKFRHLTPALSPVEAERVEALWLVHALHKFAGLRNDEIAQARVEWFTRAPWGQVFLGVIRRAYFEPKQSEGFVPIHSEVAALLAPFVQDRQPLDYLVLTNATVTDRAELIYRTHAQFIRKFLPAAQFAKAGYELRRWAAQVFELKHGLDASENFLRHKRKGVAAAHYLDEWARWRRLGPDLGITLAEARGESTIEVLGTWKSGADVFKQMGDGRSKLAQPA
jgi:hypothetical protein